MRRLLGLRNLVHDAVDAITQLVEDTQDESFERSVALLSLSPALGGSARLVDGMRRAVSGPVFAGIRATNRGVQAIGDGVFELARELSQTTSGRSASEALTVALAPVSTAWADAAQGALNAALGDYLHERGNDLATELGFYQQGRRLEPTPQHLASALPCATDKLCVFIHGLAVTELAWWTGAQQYHGDPGLSLGTLLQRERGFTPIYLRYNTGRHVSENGRELAAELSRLIAAYPLPVREIALVGHSMGGLLARSAAHYARREHEPWIDALTHVLCIGSPHTGSFLEKTANLAASVLNAYPLAGTQVPAKILNARSAGIKDLRFGYVLDEDWTRADPDALLTDNRHDVPLVPCVTYGFMASTFVRDASHPMGTLLGDLLVRVPSASGKARAAVRDVPFHIGCVLPGLSHLALLNHPDVYPQLLRFLSLHPGDASALGKPEHG